MLRKEPPAVKKAQRPMQRVMMKMGTRLASYQGFRNVWGTESTMLGMSLPATCPRSPPKQPRRGERGAWPSEQSTAPVTLA